MAVSDSGPLMWLAEAGRVGLLKTLFEEVVVPSEVYREVVLEGLRLGFSDALAVEEAVKEGWIKVEALDGEERELSLRLAEGAREIHVGEAQAMALARGWMRCCLWTSPAGGRWRRLWASRREGLCTWC